MINLNEYKKELKEILEETVNMTAFMDFPDDLIIEISLENILQLYNEPENYLKKVKERKEVAKQFEFID